MTAIAGLVAAPPLHAGPGAAGEMLGAMALATAEPVQVWQEGRAALGAMSRPGAPALYSDQYVAVVADSRFDNRQELCRELGLRESHTSDAALIAAAFTRWGAASVGRLRGDFAFALWDRRSAELFCARDRFGVRPFCYRQLDRSFRFASEAKALAPEDGLASLAVDQDWLVDFVAGVVTDATGTAYADIRRLPPAHVLRLKNGKIATERYWSFDDIPRSADGAGPKALREAFIEAVQCRLSDGAAAFLSGGLDSSSVCGVASRLRHEERGRAMETVSIVFDDTPEASERREIETVLAAGRYNPRFVNVTRYRPLAILPRLIDMQDGPFLGPGVPLMDEAYRVTAGDGFGVVLDGHGGDEVISSGMGRLNDLARAAAWGPLVWELTAYGARHGVNPLPLFADYVAFYDRGLPARALRRLGGRRGQAAASGSSLLAAAWQGDERAAHRHQPYRRQPPQSFDSEQDHHRAVLASPLQGYAFEVLGRISRHHGLDSRFPFWDQSVVELCIRSQSADKLSNGWPRALIRSAMKGIVPEPILHRADKLDFSGHMVRGLLEDKAMLLDIASSGESAFDGFVDRAAFADNVRRLEDSDPSARAAAAHLVIRGAGLAMWLASRSPVARPRAQLECQH